MFLLICIAIATVGYFIHYHYQHWKRRGVPGPKPTFFIGNLGPCYRFKKSPSQLYAEIYNAYPNASIVGIFRSTSPTLLARDPEVIKEVIVKSFSNFHDNELYINKNVDPLFGRNPFVLRGEEWKIARHQLTPCFTSGKMKTIYPILEDISERLVSFIESQPPAVNGKGYEAKELAKRFTLNNVGSCAFGLEARCFEEEKSDFKRIADNFIAPDAWNSIKLFLVGLIPALNNVLSFRFTPKDVEEELTNITAQALKYREENNVIRNDFLHILNQLKKSSNNQITDIDITAHAAGFFGDGHETSSIVMSFLLYELAANPETQSKLREEIKAAFEANNGKLPYEVIQGLPYLDAALNESLRLHAPFATLAKVCCKSFVFNPKEGDDIKNSVTVDKGTTVLIPLYGLHRDSKYFEKPDLFKPERFVGTNKDSITKYSFLPFGEGPRSCLGQRFGILQIKVGIAYIIQNYELFVNRKTKQPIEYDPIYFLTAPKGGLWLDFKKIS